MHPTLILADGSIANVHAALPGATTGQWIFYGLGIAVFVGGVIAAIVYRTLEAAFAYAVLGILLSLPSLFFTPHATEVLAQKVESQLGVSFVGDVDDQLHGFDRGPVAVALEVDGKGQGCQVAVVSEDGNDYDLLVTCDGGALPRVDEADSRASKAPARN